MARRIAGAFGRMISRARAFLAAVALALAGEVRYTVMLNFRLALATFRIVGRVFSQQAPLIMVGGAALVATLSIYIDGSSMTGMPRPSRLPSK